MDGLHIPPPTSSPTITTPVTTAPPTAPLQTTTSTKMPVATTTSPSLYSRFSPSCKDQLEPGLCSMLKSSQDVCHKNIDLCPMTCGICNVISSANCHDGILNNGCLSMYVTPGKCGDQLARFTCPKSCGYCDAIVSKKIQDLINSPTSKLATKTATAPTTTTTT